MPTERLNRLFRLKDLPQYCGLRRTQISELVKAGQFPKPIPLSDSGRAVAWLEHDLIAWQSARITARNATEATTPSKAKVAGAVFNAAVSNGGVTHERPGSNIRTGSDEVKADQPTAEGKGQ